MVSELIDPKRFLIRARFREITFNFFLAECIEQKKNISALIISSTIGFNQLSTLIFESKLLRSSTKTKVGIYLDATVYPPTLYNSTSSSLSYHF